MVTGMGGSGATPYHHEPDVVVLERGIEVRRVSGRSAVWSAFSPSTPDVARYVRLRESPTPSRPPRSASQPPKRPASAPETASMTTMRPPNASAIATLTARNHGGFGTFVIARSSSVSAQRAGNPPITPARNPVAVLFPLRRLIRYPASALPTRTAPSVILSGDRHTSSAVNGSASSPPTSAYVHVSVNWREPIRTTPEYRPLPTKTPSRCCSAGEWRSVYHARCPSRKVGLTAPASGGAFASVVVCRPVTAPNRRDGP